LTNAERKALEDEQRKAGNLRRLKGFRPIDDTFMKAMMKDNKPLAEFVLRIIMDKPSLRLVKFNTQDELKMVTGARSVTLDVTATDDEGRKYDIEIQRADMGAEPERGRYHSSAMDVESLPAGHPFKDLPTTYVIFITEGDYYEVGASIYPIQRVNMVTGKLYGDRSMILYVNGAYRGDDDMGRLMHDFCCSDPDEMNYGIMADRARYYKESTEGVREMCKAMDDLRIESEKRGEKIGLEKGLKRGEKRGIKKGEDNITTLMLKLFALGRDEDLKRASADKEYCAKLLAEFGIVS